MDTTRPISSRATARTGVIAGTVVALVLAVSVLTGSSATAAQTLRVAQQDSGCSDTTGAPYCTIGAANRVAAAGDVIEVSAGTYREQVTAVAGVTYRGVSSAAVVAGSDAMTGPWSDAGGGTWSMPVAGTAPVSGVYAGSALLTHASAATSMAAGTWFFDSTARTLYLNLGGPSPSTGVEAVRRSFGILVRSTPGVHVASLHFRAQGVAGVEVESSSGVTVKDAVATGSLAYGFNVTGSSTVTASGVTASKNASNGVHLLNTTSSIVSAATTAGNGFHGISVTGGSDDIVRGSVSHDNARAGARVATGISVNGGSLRALVERNTTYANDDSGIEIYTGSTGALVRRNLSYGNGDHGIDISQSPGARVVSNTVVSNVTSGINVEGQSVNTTVRDNVAALNATTSTRGRGDLRVETGSETGTTADRDLFYQGGGSTPAVVWTSTSYTDVASLRTATGQEVHGLFADPRFNDAAHGDFGPAEGSPAIDRADSSVSGFLLGDRLGVTPADDPTVPNTGTGSPAYADLGAFERPVVVTPPPTTPPPTTPPPTPAPVVDRPPVARLSVHRLHRITVWVHGHRVRFYRVRLSAAASTDDHGIRSYRFRCGAQRWTAALTTDHRVCRFRKAGTKTVRVVVTDTIGQRAYAVRTVRLRR